MPQTKHAQVRAQQRAIRVFFSHRSVRRMEQALGHQPVTMFKRYLAAYKVETTDGATITKGWRTGRITRT